MGSSRGRSVSEVVSGQAFADQLQKYKGQPQVVLHRRYPASRKTEAAVKTASTDLESKEQPHG